MCGLSRSSICAKVSLLTSIRSQFIFKDLGIYEQFACSQEFQVPCWVPRPWEKRIFLLYMMLAQTIAIILILLGKWVLPVLS